MASALHNLSDYDFASVPNAADMKFGIVVSEWNSKITGALLQGAFDTLTRHGAKEDNIFLMAHLLEDVEVKHRAVACRQSAHHLVDGVGRNVADGWVVRLWLVGNVVTEWCKLMPLVASQEFQRLVDDHPCGPSRQGACPAILEIADVGEDVNESVLKHILLIVLIDDVSGADACQVVGI